ncbi:MAG: PilZ domain-containing protein [Nitrospinota bacterium]|nr:PilZ domain-containing protein [Nitrospinota bacterium]
MDPKILDVVENLNMEELVELRGVVDGLIKKTFENDLGKRGGKRVPITIPATCEIEREKQFFEREFRITILEMSASGLMFRTKETFLVDDLVAVFFRSPSSGVKKKIDCKILRVTDTANQDSEEFNVAAKAVTQKEVRKYKDWLSKRQK